MKYTHIAVAIVLATAFRTSAATIHVATNGLHVAPFTNWVQAATNVQDAIDVAVPGDEIWVAAGRYRPTSEFGGTGDRFQAFQLKADVAVYGGFAGTEDPASFDMDDRDFAANETVLCGDLGVEGSMDDNAYHVVVGATAARLDGFTVTNGNANGSSPHYSGGGIYCNGTAPVIANCMIAGNRASSSGGGMYVANAAPQVVDCTFSGNRAEGGYAYGGAIRMFSASPMVLRCTFLNNEVSASFTANGGALYSSGSSAPTIIGCVFTGNAVIILPPEVADRVIEPCFDDPFPDYDTEPACRELVRTGDDVREWLSHRDRCGASPGTAVCVSSGCLAVTRLFHPRLDCVRSRF